MSWHRVWKMDGNECFASQYMQNIVAINYTETKASGMNSNINLQNITTPFSLSLTSVNIRPALGSACVTQHHLCTSGLTVFSYIQIKSRSESFPVVTQAPIMKPYLELEGGM